MRIVSSVPEAPTRAPATMSTFSWRTNPVAAAARPVNAFRSEITTGISAPPIGRTNSTPKTAAAPIIAQITQPCSVPATIETASVRAPRATRALTTCWPGYVIGRPLRSSCSFANATSEPANEIAPMSPENATDTASSPSSPPPSVELRERDERRRTAADAVEQRHHLRHRGHLHAARADDAHGPADRHRRCRSRGSFESPSASVTTIAITIPAAPTRFPSRARRGEERNRSATMKHTIATR